jgi:hypothetical protein
MQIECSFVTSSTYTLRPSKSVARKMCLSHKHTIVTTLFLGQSSTQCVCLKSWESFDHYMTKWSQSELDDSVRSWQDLLHGMIGTIDYKSSMTCTPPVRSVNVSKRVLVATKNTRVHTEFSCSTWWAAHMRCLWTSSVCVERVLLAGSTIA